LLWIVAALATAIIFTIANIFDSHMLSKRMPSMASYVLPIGICQFLIGLVILLFFPFPHNAGFTHLLVAFGSGFANAFAIVILLTYLQKGEVSRVVPVVTSSPIFVALLSMPLLGELLGFWQWVAVLGTVAGAILVSLQRDGSANKTRLHKSFFVLLAAALMSAVSNIGYKYALAALSYWNMMSVTGICVVIVIMFFTLRRSTLVEIKNLDQRNQKMALLVGNQLFAAIGSSLSFVAIANGPVALATAIMNIRPAFIFLFSLALSRFYPNFINERFNKKTILAKFIGIALITGGVVIISLSSK
jgi:drug/metabolite transporter (DMT)-like permease